MLLMRRRSSAPALPWCALLRAQWVPNQWCLQPA